MRLKFSVLLVALFVQGCSYNKVSVKDEVEAGKYDPVSMARVRVFSSPESVASYYPGLSCAEAKRVGFKGAKPLRVHENKERYILGRKADLLGMKVEDYRNTTIGMPISETTQELEKDRLAYNEVVVPADVSSVFSMFYSVNDQNVRAYCYPPNVSISPRAGADYELRLILDQKSFGRSSCHVSVKELIGKESVKKVSDINFDVCDW
ncbi:hypothetical protein [Pseudomonas sp.]|uniref:hypothetical protein n=1 Tax=Pseudomonas sp. TaxID=306 RepID=UPI003D0D1639